MTTLLRANGLLGHILDPSDPVDLFRPDRMASPPPTLSPCPLLEKISIFNLWWDRDNIAQHILVSRLGNVPCGHIPPPPNIETCTALSIYQLLTKYYGTCSFVDCTELLNSLHNSTCTPGRVPDFVAKWQTGLFRLQSARFVFNVKICMSLFVCGLPLISAFTIISATLPDRLAGASEFDLGPFITLTGNTLKLDTIFHAASQSQGPLPARSSSQVTPAPSSSATPPAAVVPSSGGDPASRSSKPVLSCENCKSRGLRCTGHLLSAWWRDGRLS